MPVGVRRSREPGMTVFCVSMAWEVSFDRRVSWRGLRLVAWRSVSAPACNPCATYLADSSLRGFPLRQRCNPPSCPSQLKAKKEEEKEKEKKEKTGGLLPRRNPSML